MEEKKDEKAEEAKAEKPKLKLNPLILLVGAAGVLVVLLIITFVVAFLMLNKPIPKKVEVKEEIGQLCNMRDFLVNLNDFGGRRYLKVSLTFEVETHGKKAKAGKEGKETPLPPEIKEKEAILRNYIINILSNRSFDDVRSVEGKNDMRKDIILKCNFVLKNTKILNVYFNDFIIQ